ncbi:MAG TPA: fibronectin type III domain-containing protein, partial [bacterium]|nr:fibronectin type III domain-containing protein [bacterium]
MYVERLMNYKKNAALILFCLSIYFFSLHTRLIAQPIDKNKNIYIYTLNKAISFDTKLIENFKWLDNYQKYLEYGVIAAGAGAVPANDTFIRLLDLSYYKKNTGLFYYSIPLNSFDEFNRLSEVQSVRNYIEMIETEVSKISNTLKTGNAEVSAFYLGALAKYITNLALWNYALGRNSHIGQAKTEVIIEFFDELDKFISSKNNFKIDRSIEWDGLVEEFDAVNFVVEMIKNSAFDYYNPLRNRDALAMYNQTLMSDALNKSITADKTLKTLSGEYVSYQDWKDDYIKRISETLNLATNYFYELLLKLPALDTRPAVEIAKLSYEANDRRVRLFWDLNINRRVERQLIYRFNSNRKVWEYLSAAPGGTQSYIVDNLENGKQYIFKVTVQEYLRPESVGKQITAVPIDNVPPAKPPKLIVQPLNKAVSLKLSAKQTDYDLANYLLYVYDDSEQLIRNIELPKDFGTFIIDNLKNKRKYKIALSAVDKALNESQESSVSYAEPMDTQPPLSIINLQAQGVNNKITITWDQPKNQFNDIDYQIVRLYDNTNKILREVKLAANVKYYFFDDVFNDYTYKIGIINIDEEDNKSKEINVSVIPVMQGDYYDLQKPDIVINDVNPFVKIYDWNNDKYLDLVAFSNENELLLL